VGQPVEGLIDVAQQRRDAGGDQRAILDRIADERQFAICERRPDEVGGHVHDPLTEAPVARRGAVVQLVGVQHVHLARPADPAFAAVPERLHAGHGDADAVRVVAMRLEAAGREVCLDALQSAGARAEADHARSFKRSVIDAT
jgi:hypothetical protein